MHAGENTSSLERASRRTHTKYLKSVKSEWKCVTLRNFRNIWVNFRKFWENFRKFCKNLENFKKIWRNFKKLSI